MLHHPVDVTGNKIISFELAREGDNDTFVHAEGALMRTVVAGARSRGITGRDYTKGGCAAHMTSSSVVHSD